MTSRNSYGFTLVEIMVVLAIIVAVVGIGIPRLFRNESDLRATVRKLISLTKEVRYQAKLKNATYRLVFRISEKESEYWVEKAKGPLRINPATFEKDLEEFQLSLEETKKKQKKEEEQPGAESRFQRDLSLTKKPIHLPSRIYFVQLETLQTKEPIREGYGFIHFSPEGLVEPSVIQISKVTGAQNPEPWTLVFNPITGQATIVDKAISLRESRHEE